MRSRNPGVGRRLGDTGALSRCGQSSKRCKRGAPSRRRPSAGSPRAAFPLSCSRCLISRLPPHSFKALPDNLQLLPARSSIAFMTRLRWPQTRRPRSRGQRSPRPRALAGAGAKPSGEWWTTCYRRTLKPTPDCLPSYSSACRSSPISLGNGEQHLPQRVPSRFLCRITSMPLTTACLETRSHRSRRP